MPGRASDAPTSTRLTSVCPSTKVSSRGGRDLLPRLTARSRAVSRRSTTMGASQELVESGSLALSALARAGGTWLSRWPSTQLCMGGGLEVWQTTTIVKTAGPRGNEKERSWPKLAESLNLKCLRNTARVTYHKSADPNKACESSFPGLQLRLLRFTSQHCETTI